MDKIDKFLFTIQSRCNFNLTISFYRNKEYLQNLMNISKVKSTELTYYFYVKITVKWTKAK